MSINKNGWIWTDERRAQVVKKWESGISAGKIAASFGPQITKNMVIGLVDRMGLKKRPSIIKRTNKKPGVTLADIGPRDCRFPLGKQNDPAEFFCGQPVQEGSPYCPEHSARCFHQSQPMKVKSFGSGKC